MQHFSHKTLIFTILPYFSMRKTTPLFNYANISYIWADQLTMK